MPMQPRPCAETSSPCEPSLMRGTDTEAASMAGAGRCSRVVGALVVPGAIADRPAVGIKSGRPSMPAAAGQWTGCHDVTAHVTKSVAVSQIKKSLFFLSLTIIRLQIYSLNSKTKRTFFLVFCLSIL